MCEQYAVAAHCVALAWGSEPSVREARCPPRSSLQPGAPTNSRFSRSVFSPTPRTIDYGNDMQTEQILAAIDAEIAKLQEAKQLLSGASASVPQKARRGRPKGSKIAPVKDQGTRKRALSVEGRAKIAEAQRKRHASRKKAAKSAAKDVPAQL